MINDIDKLLKSLQEDESEKEKIIEPIEKDSIELITYSQEFLFENIKTYTDVCKYLKEPIESDPYLQIKQIVKLFNGDWKVKFDGKQKNYYPYFYCSGGFRFFGSGANLSNFLGMVSYYKNRETSDFVGRTFLDIYEKLSKSY